MNIFFQMEKKKKRNEDPEKENSDPEVDFNEFQEFLERKKIQNKILKEMIDQLQQPENKIKTRK